MKFQLNKWYFDFFSESDIGYYYIMSLQIGNHQIGASGIYHFNSKLTNRSFKISKNVQDSIHSLKLNNAAMTMSRNFCELHIDHGQIGINGKWHSQSHPLRRLTKPLYQETGGWCDWKVWMPLSKVQLALHHQKKRVSIKGAGYVDFVRFAFLFWKTPFNKLYWGRLHCLDSWIVLFLATTKTKTLSFYFDPQGVTENVSMELKKNREGEIEAFDWFIRSRNDSQTLHAETLRCLEDQEILDRSRLFRMLPRNLIRRISSFGSDKKYEVASVIENKRYSGIMEEVTWHER